jgi:predicted nuclease of predicted toxin-antitoxin system
LLDIPISTETAGHLRAAGHDCELVRVKLNPRASDPEIVQHAADDDRVVLCFDLDMATLVALSGRKLPSIITFRTKQQDPPYINERLDSILPLIAEDLRAGVLATVEEDRVRLRELPVLKA